MKLVSPLVQIFFTDSSKAVPLLWISFVIKYFMFVMLSCLFIAALSSPAQKGLTSWLYYMLCLIVLFFLSLSHVVHVLDQVWYLIVSIPDLCLLTYFERILGLSQFVPGKKIQLQTNCYVF